MLGEFIFNYLVCVSPTPSNHCHCVMYFCAGPSEDCDDFEHESRGVIPRSFEYIFNQMNKVRFYF